MRPRPWVLWILLGLFGSLLLGTTPAPAVEYRLLVASIFDATLMSFVSPPELLNGASGPGLQRVEKGLLRCSTLRPSRTIRNLVKRFPRNRYVCPVG